jgi:hypothetical protein
MKTLRLLSVALFAVLAFGAIAVASASALTELPAEWLVNGEPVTVKLATDADGELLLEDTKTPIGVVQVLCEGLLDGFVGPGGEDETTELLNRAGTILIGPGELEGTALECVNEFNCPSPLVWAANLPWKTLLVLVVDGAEELWVDLISKPGWYVECMTFVPLTDLCEPSVEGASLMLNLPSDVGAEFSEAITELVGLKLANCTSGGAESGVVQSDAEGLVEVPGSTLQAFS